MIGLPHRPCRNVGDVGIAEGCAVPAFHRKEMVASDDAPRHIVIEQPMIERSVGEFGTKRIGDLRRRTRGIVIALGEDAEAVLHARPGARIGVARAPPCASSPP